jgi:hypothetical protein
MDSHIVPFGSGAFSKSIASQPSLKLGLMVAWCWDGPVQVVDLVPCWEKTQESILGTQATVKWQRCQRKREREKGEREGGREERKEGGRKEEGKGGGKLDFVKGPDTQFEGTTVTHGAPMNSVVGFTYIMGSWGSVKSPAIGEVPLWQQTEKCELEHCLSKKI